MYRPGSRVGPYEVVRQLGSGGMGEVYLAHDTRLGRDVALKVVVPRDGLPAAHALMLHEARAAAALTHPNIVAVHDVVEHETRLHVIMERVDGESLASRLARGRCSVREVLRIGLDVFAALEHAHARGIVHCDLKPANILLATDGQAKVVDFGLARSLHAAAQDATTMLVSNEASAWLGQQVVGTPEYMAPELFTGTPPSRESDLYSAGVVLFEMATGRHPFGRVIARPSSTRIGDALVRLAPQVPAEFADLLSHLLEEDPHVRLESAAEARDALAAIEAEHEEDPAGTGDAADADVRDARRVRSPTPRPVARRSSRRRAPLPHLPWLAVFSVAVCLVLWFALGRQSLVGRAQAPPSIALLPFTTSSPNVAAESLAAGLTEFVGADLRSLAGLLVVSPSPRVGLTRVDESSIGNELGVARVVGGSVERDGSALRVHVRLIDAASRRIVADDMLDGRSSELGELVRSVVAAVRRQLRQSGIALADLASAPPQVPPEALFQFSGPAFEDYAQGLLYLDGTGRGSLDSAIGLFESAVRKLPTFARAHAALGDAYWQKWQTTKDPQWAQRAEDAVLEAVRLAPGAAEVHYALAVQYRSRGRRDDAIAEVQRAIALRPNSDDGHRLLGRLLAESGRIDDALRAFDTARTLRPGYGENFRAAGIALFDAGRYREAAAALSRAAELMPSNASTLQALGTVLHASGDLDGALANYRKAIAIAPSGRSWSNIAFLHYSRKEYREAVSAYEQATALLPHSPITQRNLADAYAKVGEPARARTTYQRAVALCDDVLRVNANDASCHVLQALCWMKTGEIAKVGPALAHPSVASSTELDVVYQRGVVDVLRGRRAQGLAEIRRAVARGYDRSLVADDDNLASVKEDPEFKTIVGAR